jgi:hypothetical protein
MASHLPQAVTCQRDDGHGIERIAHGALPQLTVAIATPAHQLARIAQRLKPGIQSAKGALAWRKRAREREAHLSDAPQLALRA